MVMMMITTMTVMMVMVMMVVMMMMMKMKMTMMMVMLMMVMMVMSVMMVVVVVVVVVMVMILMLVIVIVVVVSDRICHLAYHLLCRKNGILLAAPQGHPKEWPRPTENAKSSRYDSETQKQPQSRMSWRTKKSTERTDHYTTAWCWLDA